MWVWNIKKRWCFKLPRDTCIIFWFTNVLALPPPLYTNTRHTHRHTHIHRQTYAFRRLTKLSFTIKVDGIRLLKYQRGLIYYGIQINFLISLNLYLGIQLFISGNDLGLLRNSPFKFRNYLSIFRNSSFFNLCLGFLRNSTFLVSEWFGWVKNSNFLSHTLEFVIKDLNFCLRRDLSLLRNSPCGFSKEISLLRNSTFMFIRC